MAGPIANTPASRARATIQAAGVQPAADRLEQEILKGCGLAEKRLELCGAATAHHRVRVLPFGQEEKAGLAAVFHAGQGGFQGAERRLAPGLVTIEAEHHLRTEPVEPIQVGLAGGGAQGGGGVVDAVLGQGDHVHIALDHQDAF